MKKRWNLGLIMAVVLVGLVSVAATGESRKSDISCAEEMSAVADFSTVRYQVHMLEESFWDSVNPSIAAFGKTAIRAFLECMER